MLARLVVAVLIAVGAIALGVISYAFFTSRSDLSRFALTDGRGVFVEDPKELKDETAASLGHLAPDFTLEDLNGQKVRLSDLRGKPVLLNFWATWCPPLPPRDSRTPRVSSALRGEGRAHGHY